MYSRTPFSYLYLVLLILPWHLPAQVEASAEIFRDSVQVILEQYAQEAPEKVLFLQETQRWCLKEARAEAIDEAWLLQLQDAFYADIQTYCRFYGWRYLVNWRALLAKAARETFWGTSYLCNRTYNYFGIRAKAKPWICASFGFCDTIEKNDPDLAAFAIFPKFEASLWMFVHTIYSRHYLDRLPDLGSRVVGAIEFERRFGFHYWEGFDRGFTFPQELGSRQYSIEETLATWSGHEINNLCVNCSWESDLKWIEKVNRTAGRTRQISFLPVLKVGICPRTYLLLRQKLELLLQLGGLQAILFSLILFFRTPATRNGRKLLAWLLLSLGMASVFHAFEELSLYVEFPHLIRLNWGLPLTFGPLLYLYVRQLTVPDAKFTQADLQHFSPYLLNLLLLLPFFLQSGESKIQILDYFTAIISRGTDIYRIYYYLLQIGIAYWGWYYTLKCLPLLKTYSDRLLGNYSEIETRQLNWMRSIVYGFMGLFVLFVLSLSLTIGVTYPEFDYEQYFYLGCFGLVYWMTSKAVKLEEIPAPSKTEIPEAPATIKPAPVRDHGADQLLQYMLTEKPYLNSDLTAVDLAKQLNLTRHQLSQILNEQLGKNFYDFINAYRVEAFKTNLQDPKFAAYSILGVALESGFKSKSSFNAIFKKVTGVTPSQYKKELTKP